MAFCPKVVASASASATPRPSANKPVLSPARIGADAGVRQELDSALGECLCQDGRAPRRWHVRSWATLLGFQAVMKTPVLDAVSAAAGHPWSRSARQSWPPPSSDPRGRTPGRQCRDRRRSARSRRHWTLRDPVAEAASPVSTGWLQTRPAPRSTSGPVLGEPREWRSVGGGTRRTQPGLRADVLATRRPQPRPGPSGCGRGPRTARCRRTRSSSRTAPDSRTGRVRNPPDAASPSPTPLGPG